MRKRDEQQFSTCPVELTFGELDAALARMHSVASERRTTFQARLKNLLKLGLLPDAQAGRGKAAAFGVGDAIIYAVAMELAQFDLPPERIIFIIKANRSAIKGAVLKGALALRVTGVRLQSAFIYFDPLALGAMMEVHGAEGRDPTEATFLICDYLDLQKNIERWTSNVGFPRLAIINVRTVLEGLIVCLENDRRPADVLTGEINAWAQGMAA